MSGGHYDYACFKIENFASQLKQDILIDDWEDYDTSNIDKVREALMESYDVIRRASELAYAVEWFMSGDYGNDTFLREYNDIMQKKYKINLHDE